MKFLISTEGSFNPRTVEEVIYEQQSWTRRYFNSDQPDEYCTQYTIYAVMTSGRKVSLGHYSDEFGAIDIRAAVAKWIQDIEEASS